VRRVAVCLLFVAWCGSALALTNDEQQAVCDAVKSSVGLELNMPVSSPNPSVTEFDLVCGAGCIYQMSQVTITYSAGQNYASGKWLIMNATPPRLTCLDCDSSECSGNTTTPVVAASSQDLNTTPGVDPGAGTGGLSSTDSTALAAVASNTGTGGAVVGAVAAGASSVGSAVATGATVVAGAVAAEGALNRAQQVAVDAASAARACGGTGQPACNVAGMDLSAAPTMPDQAARVGDAKKTSDDALKAAQDGVPVQYGTDKASFFSWVWTPPTASCAPFAGTMHGYSLSWDICPAIGNIRDVLGWLFALFGALSVYGNLFRRWA
jgi:hypothetical protein